MNANQVTTLPYIEPKIEPISAVLVNLERYDDLIHKETRLELLENAVRTSPYMSDIKKLFSLEGAAD